MRRGLSVFVVVAAMGLLAVGAASGGGNSDAAHACQQNGYLNLHRSDGSSFKNTGDCVSYFAQNHTLPACTFTATSGCMTFDNVVVNNDAGQTLTLDGAFSINTTCNTLDPSTTCPTNPLVSPFASNTYAAGGGTYVISDSSGVIEQGTLTVGPTASFPTGLISASYQDISTGLIASCTAADARNILVAAATNNAFDAAAEVGGGVSTDALTGPVSNVTFVPEHTQIEFLNDVPVAGTLSITC